LSFACHCSCPIVEDFQLFHAGFALQDPISHVVLCIPILLGSHKDIVLPSRHYLHRWLSSPTVVVTTLDQTLVYSILKHSSHSVMQAPPFSVEPHKLDWATNQVLVNDPRNQGSCPCGWYCFYGTCGRLVQQHPHRCGRKVTPSGKRGFCGTPAPQNVVRSYYINRRCDDCCRRGL